MRTPLILAAAAIAAVPAADASGGSVARLWNEQLLDAIRADRPKPTVHARNLFHASGAMYDAWSAYDAGGAGYLFDESHAGTAADRDEAVSHAAYRVLRSRYAASPGAAGDAGGARRADGLARLRRRRRLDCRQLARRRRQPGGGGVLGLRPDRRVERAERLRRHERVRSRQRPDGRRRGRRDGDAGPRPVAAADDRRRHAAVPHAALGQRRPLRGGAAGAGRGLRQRPRRPAAGVRDRRLQGGRARGPPLQRDARPERRRDPQRLPGRPRQQPPRHQRRPRPRPQPGHGPAVRRQTRSTAATTAASSPSSGPTARPARPRRGTGTRSPTTSATTRCSRSASAARARSWATWSGT